MSGFLIKMHRPPFTFLKAKMYFRNENKLWLSGKNCNQSRQHNFGKLFKLVS